MQFDATQNFLVSRNISRRQVLAAAGLLALPAALPGISLASSLADAHNLACEEAPNEYRRIKIVVESSGNLLVKPIVAAVKGKVVNQSEAPIRQVPFEVNVTQLYDERVISHSESAIQSLRYYRELDGKLNIAKSTSKPEINEQRRWISAKVDGEGRCYFSPNEPLKREELDLVDVPANPLTLNKLSPGKSVKVGETWTHENAVLESLLGVDQVIEQKDVQSKLQEVKNDIATVILSGGIVGSVQSAKTQLLFQAKYSIDLKTKQVVSLAMGLSERRDVSASQPGYESTTKIRLATMAMESVTELDESNKDRMKLDDPLAGKLLTFESAKGGFRFVHDSRWHNMIDRVDGSVLRLVDRGDIVAQCTITDLPKLSAGQRTSLDSFQAEVKNKLGKSFQMISEANESTTESGLTLQRVVATAMADEVPVLWVYYMAMRDDGRRVALMFTHDANMTDRFASADATIASSFELIEKNLTPSASAAAPTPAKAADAKTSSLKSGLK